MVFRVPRFVRDYREVLSSDVDAVLLCHTDPKTEVAVASFHAGKHVFIEKPLSYSLQDADAIIAAAKSAGTVGLVGYTKLFDPAFEMAQLEVEPMGDIRFVQVNQFHPSNSLHIARFRTWHFDDVPEGVMTAGNAARTRALQQATGSSAADVQRAFLALSGSVIHDLYGLRTLFGSPTRVVSADIWNEGRALTATLEYPQRFRCVMTWVDLPRLWDFRETLEVCSDTKRVLVNYSTGFSRGTSGLVVQEVESDGSTVEKRPAIPWELPFRRELRHFHACITQNVAPRSSPDSAREDIALIIDVVKRYLDNQ